MPAAAKYGLRCAFEAGEALLEANKICPLGKWLTWLAANFQGSRRTALRYMDFATEVKRLGGLDGSTLTHTTPHEDGRVLAKLLVLPSGKKKPKVAGNRQGALASAAPAEAPAAGASTVVALNRLAIDPFPRFVELFQELLTGLEVVVHGENCHDAPFAEMLLMDLRTPFADLLEYVSDRDLHKRR